MDTQLIADDLVTKKIDDPKFSRLLHHCTLCPPFWLKSIAVQPVSGFSPLNKSFLLTSLLRNNGTVTNPSSVIVARPSGIYNYSATDRYAIQRGLGQSYRTCQKQREVPPTCANCQGEHTANYCGCPSNPKNRVNRHLDGRGSLAPVRFRTGYDPRNPYSLPRSSHLYAPLARDLPPSLHPRHHGWCTDGTCQALLKSRHPQVYVRGLNGFHSVSSRTYHSPKQCPSSKQFHLGLEST